MSRAVALDGKDANLRSRLGDVLRERQRFADAVEQYNKAISLRADFPRRTSAGHWHTRA